MSYHADGPGRPSYVVFRHSAEALRKVKRIKDEHPAGQDCPDVRFPCSCALCLAADDTSDSASEESHLCYAKIGL